MVLFDEKIYFGITSSRWHIALLNIDSNALIAKHWFRCGFQKFFGKNNMPKHLFRNESFYPIKGGLWLKLFIFRVFEDLSARIKDLKSTCNWSNHNKQVYQDSFEDNLAIFLSQLSKCIETLIRDFCRSNGKRKVFLRLVSKLKD